MSWIKKMLILIVILCVIVVGKNIFFPGKWKYGNWAQVSYYHKVLYDFCTYKIPQTYGLTDYREGIRRRLIIYEDKETKQIFLISKMREFLKIELDNADVNKEKVKITMNGERYPLNNYLQLMYLLPVLRNDEIKTTPDDLLIKGFVLKAEKTIETPETEIKYFEGNFDKRVGLYKPTKSLIKYPVPVFEFTKPYKGAMAIINNKKTGESLISIGAVPEGKNFDTEEYINILKTISFETVPWEDKYGLRKGAGII